MNWTWATSLDQVWRSPAFPMWLTLAAAAFFAVIILITLVRAEKSVANGALTVITLLAIGIAVAATIRGFGPEGQIASGATRSPEVTSAVLPAFSCIDDLAGDAVLAACEKALFGSPDTAAAAVSYAAAQLARLAAAGDAATANKNMTPELQALRHAVEHDRYGLMAQVLSARDHCTPSECAVFASLTDRRQIAANMDERTYDGLISRYAPVWNAPTTSAPAAALLSSLPTGRPTNADFPTAASIPPVSIMNPEPPVRGAPPSGNAASTPRPAPALAAAKKPAAPKPPRASAPVQIAPVPAEPAGNGEQ
jgi:hypothetical protein